MTYRVEKSKSNGLWWVLDAEGYEVNYIGYDFKGDAIKAMRVRKIDDLERQRQADHVDGYDRDDLGESPDY